MSTGVAAHDLAGGPGQYRTPALKPTLSDAQRWCRNLAANHYENFHVATLFLPRRLRPHFECIYAFSRVADDLGDEVSDPAQATRLLTDWQEMLNECYDAPEQSRHPVFIALRRTISETTVPRELFCDLIRAFKQDQIVTEYESLEQLVEYSRLSANPVGRLVLWVSGYRDEERALLSDRVCTALQLANFWQDVVEDHERGRRYLPADSMFRFNVEGSEIAARKFTPGFRDMLAFLVEYARTMLLEGGTLSGSVDRELAVTLKLFWKGGEAALNGIVEQGYDVLRARPCVRKQTKLKLLSGALVDKLVWSLRA